MSNRFALLLLAIAAIPWSATRAAGWPVEIIEVMDQERIVLFLDAEQMANVPTWRPGQSEATLSLDGVVAALTAYMTGDAELAGGEIQEMEFKPIRSHQLRDRWYCLARVELPDGTRRYLAVLPGGAVVAAIVEPRP